ncbi:hypothetical protein quinque_013653 [Culex quinquefasciatus]
MVKRGFLAGKSTGMILLDVEKAYDSVWQDAVVYKLFRSNLQPFLVKIVESFLTNRSFTVTLAAKLKFRKITTNLHVEFGGKILMDPAQNLFRLELLDHWNSYLPRNYFPAKGSAFNT